VVFLYWKYWNFRVDERYWEKSGVLGGVEGYELRDDGVIVEK
jgi:hypothetical protein